MFIVLFLICYLMSREVIQCNRQQSMIKNQAISTHNDDELFIALDELHAEMLHLFEQIVNNIRK